MVSGHRRLLAPISVGVRSSAIRSQPRGAAAASTAMMPSRSSIRYKGDLLLPISRGGGDDAASTADAGSTSTSTPSRPKGLKYLRLAYTATGVATAAAWSTMVYTTIRSNQPPGAMMPCWQHGVFARIGAMSAAGLIGGCFASLAATASRATSWEDLGTSKSCLRHNLALVTTGVASSFVGALRGTNYQDSWIHASRVTSGVQRYHASQANCVLRLRCHPGCRCLGPFPPRRSTASTPHLAAPCRGWGVQIPP